MTILGKHSKEFLVSVNSGKAVKVYDQGAGLLEYNAVSIYDTKLHNTVIKFRMS